MISRIMRILTQQQADHYHEQGYVIIDKLIDADKIAGLAEHLRLAALGKLGPGVTIGRERGLTGEATSDEDALLRVRKVSNLARHDEFFRDLVANDHLVSIGRDLLGDEIRYLGDEAQLKPARYGSPHPWHQDEPYFKEMAIPIATIWISVDRATQANGCMQVIPKSHLSGIVERKDERRFWLTDDEVDTSAAVHAELEAGGALIFHSRLLHGSGPNQTDHCRRSMICRYGDVSTLSEHQKSVFDQYGVVLDGPAMHEIFQPVA